MNKPGHIEQETTEEDCEVEIINLDPPDKDGRGKSSWLASTLLHWQRSPNRQHYRRYWRWACTLGILLFLVIMISLTRVPSSLTANGFKNAFYPQSHSYSLTALPTPPPPPQDGIACLADATWSPDGTSIAVLGYQDCPENSYGMGMVNLYDAQSRHLLSQWLPGETILLALGRPLSSPLIRPFGKRPPPGSTPVATEPPISYEHVIWSPNGQRLAVTFELTAQKQPVHGVALMNRDGRSVQVMLKQQSVAPPFYAEWDLDRSANTAASTIVPGPLAPALAYHWGANGRLVPVKLLSNNVVPAESLPGPVGNPDGSASFTIWQPGLANFISLADSMNVDTWSTDFAAWSPDGRYLIDGISLTVLLQPSGQHFPSPKALVASGMDQAPLLPIHDAALLTVVDRPTAIAWSPNGHVLAAYTAGNIVNLFDCNDGRKIASFRVNTKSAAPPAQAVVMRWSPDGSRLLLSSEAWGLVSLWSLRQSPQ